MNGLPEIFVVIFGSHASDIYSASFHRWLGSAHIIAPIAAHVASGLTFRAPTRPSSPCAFALLSPAIVSRALLPLVRLRLQIIVAAWAPTRAPNYGKEHTTIVL